MSFWRPTIPNLLTETPSGRRWMSSTAMSFVLHATVVVVCGFWLLPMQAEPRVATLDTVWSDDAAPELLEQVPRPLLLEQEIAGGTSEGTALIEEALSDSHADHAIDIDEVSGIDWQLTDAVDPATLTDTVSLSGGGGRGVRDWLGGGEGLGAAIGNANGASQFFGSPVEGDRVVYVVDASRSMNRPHPGPMVTRFGRVKYELIRSISQMTPDQEFYIIYFNDRALPMPSRTAVPATSSAQQKYLRWAAEFRADGPTNPEFALALALKLKPDVMYFLTDGRFPAKIVKQVAEANLMHVVIHTIGFAADEGEQLLKAIAGQNGGEYRFIPAAEAGP